LPRYHITVLNPEQRCCDVRSAELDGVAVDPHAIPLLSDSATHEVVVVVGRGDSTALELSSDDPASSTDGLIHRLAGRDCDSVFKRNQAPEDPPEQLWNA
jgi:hypothetical protein